jgi:pimeloyl-ACP methyl ester carboxylesterase
MEWPSDLLLILLPGLDGTGLLFEPLLTEMPVNARISIIRYPAIQAFSYSQLSNYVAHQLPRNQELVLLAESFSGPLAIELLKTTSLQIKGVIFCATFAQAPSSLLLTIAQFLPLALLFRLPIPSLAIRWYCLDKTAPQFLVMLCRKALTEVKPRILAQRIRELATVNATLALENLEKIPCCYLQATDDKLVPSHCLTPFQKAIPNLFVAPIKGPHFILQTRPKECAKILTKFISNLN